MTLVVRELRRQKGRLRSVLVVMLELVMRM